MFRLSIEGDFDFFDIMGFFFIPKKLSLRSLTRKFVGSDGREYKWSYQVVDKQQWTVSVLDRVHLETFLLQPPTVMCDRGGLPCVYLELIIPNGLSTVHDEGKLPRGAL